MILVFPCGSYIHTITSNYDQNIVIKKMEDWSKNRLQVRLATTVSSIIRKWCSGQTLGSIVLQLNLQYPVPLPFFLEVLELKFGVDCVLYI